MTCHPHPLNSSHSCSIPWFQTNCLPCLLPTNFLLLIIRTILFSLASPAQHPHTYHLGQQIKDPPLKTTTFMCHNCALPGEIKGNLERLKEPQSSISQLRGIAQQRGNHSPFAFSRTHCREGCRSTLGFCSEI